MKLIALGSSGFGAAESELLRISSTKSQCVNWLQCAPTHQYVVLISAFDVEAAVRHLVACGTRSRQTPDLCEGNPLLSL